jgi:catechol 2,3-dioxygenase-like lactoylglutathione lyase family enzyme
VGGIGRDKLNRRNRSHQQRHVHCPIIWTLGSDFQAFWADQLVRNSIEGIDLTIGDRMADQSPFSTSVIHHTGLRVADVKAATRWLTTMLGFRVEYEFEVAGYDFVWLSAADTKFPVIELIGGPLDKERQLPENFADLVKLSGWQHICLQVRDIEVCVSDLRRRGVKILIDVTGAVLRVAFIADPWGNVYELLEAAEPPSRPNLSK